MCNTVCKRGIEILVQCKTLKPTGAGAMLGLACKYGMGLASGNLAHTKDEWGGVMDKQVVKTDYIHVESEPQSHKSLRRQQISQIHSQATITRKQAARSMDVHLKLSLSLSLVISQQSITTCFSQPTHIALSHSRSSIPPMSMTRRSDNLTALNTSTIQAHALLLIGS